MRRNNTFRRLFAGIAAVIGMGAPQLAPTKVIQTNQQQQQTNVKINDTRKPIKVSNHLNFDGSGDIIHSEQDMGFPPKYYGQYLQRIGRQKWTISQKSRRYKK